MRIALLLIAVGVSVCSIAKPPSRIKFIENRNQWGEGIDFVSKIPGGAMQVRPGSFTYFFYDQKRMEEYHLQSHLHSAGMSEARPDILIDGVRVEVIFVGANPAAVAHGIGKSSEYYNYFLGNDPSKWASKAHGYDGFLYASLYNGIDLKTYVTGGNLKYDFLIAPGADASDIVIDYAGANGLELDNGDLLVHTALAQIREKSPVAYQVIDGKKVYVRCEFVLDGTAISFHFPDGFDSCYELVIDPLLIFSTFSGSEADNWGSTATPGENGTLYSGGITSHTLTNGVDEGILSGTFPKTPGAFQTTWGGEFDVAIFKYDSLGRNVLYASYLGGNHCETPHSLIMNSNNELVIFGTTESTNFPTTQTAMRRNFAGGSSVNSVFVFENGTDMFVARISPDGTQMLASSYIGGPLNDGGNFIGSELRRNYGDDLRGDVITDDDNNIYISTVAESTNLSTLNTFGGGQTDALLMKLPPDLTHMVWSRYIGGSGNDAAHTLKFSNDHIYTAGGTTSANFPVAGTPAQATYAGGVDGWIAEISLDGQTIHNATYTGSADFDMVYFLDVNASGEVYVYGQTDGDRPIFPADIYRNENSGQFLQKFTPDLSQALFYTVFGSGKGTPDISPTAFLVNECNNVYMAGWGGTLNLAMDGGNAFDTHTFLLEATEDAYQKTSQGHDFYLIVMSPDAKEKLYATFMGGDSRTHVDGGTSRFDKHGVVYHAVCAGCGNSDDFPTTSGSVSRTNNSLNCNNAAFKFDLSSLKAIIDIKGEDHICIPQQAVLGNISIGGERYYWNFGDGTPIVEQTELRTVTHEYKNPGVYTVWLKAFDPGTCRTSDSVSIKMTVDLAEAKFPDDAALCEGESKTLAVTGGVAYQWKNKDGEVLSTSPSFSITPREDTWVYVNVTEAVGCVMRDSVFLEVVPKMNVDFEFERLADCVGAHKLTVKNLTDSLLAGDQLYFDFGDGVTSDLAEVSHVFNQSGSYNVKLIGMREFCPEEKVVPMAFGPLKFPNVITPGLQDEKNDTFVIQYGDEAGPTPSDFGFRTRVVIYDRWGRRVYENEDYQSEWSGSDVSTGVYYYEVTVAEHATCKGWVHLVK